MNNMKERYLLLVEDEILIAMLEKRELENAGYEVMHVSSGGKALEIIRTNEKSIDLILMDINLGEGMDGIETAAEILKNREIPVVFLSSHTEKKIVEKTGQITSYGYVMKESGITVLNASIKMAFRLFNANKRTEQQKNQLKTILNSIGDAVISANLDGKIIQMNPIAENLTGFKFDEAYGKPLCEVFQIINADTRESEKNPVDLVISSGSIVKLANHTILISRNGKEYPIADSSSPITDSNGKITGVVLVFRDITEEYETQKRIKRSEGALNEAQRIAKIGSWEYNLSASEMYISKEIYSIFEIDKNIPADKMPDYMKSRIHPEDRIAYNQMMTAALKKGEGFSVVNRVILENGKVKYIAGIREMIKDDNGIITGYRETLQDITDHKKTEENLRASEECFSKVFRSSPAPLVITDIATGKILDTNEKWIKLTGYSAEEMTGRTTKELGIYADWSLREKVVEELRQKGFIKEAPFRIITKSGETREVLWSVEIIKLGGRDVMLSLVYDIAERKCVEEKLRKSEASLENAQALAHIGSWEIDPVIKIGYWSKELFRLFGYDETVKMPVFNDFIMKVNPADRDRLLEAEKRVMETGKSESVEFRISAHPMGERHFETTMYAIKSEEGKLLNMTGIVLDITERKQAETHIKKLLREKEILLKEIHHSIKNNIMTISAFLRIQALAQDNASAGNILLNAAGRVQSMSILYDKLYRSETCFSVSIKEYFASLLNEIMSIFPGKEKIKVKTEFDHIILNARILSPLGIITYELIMNSMKHAFKDRDEGLITLKASLKENQVFLIFGDDGHGIPESTTFENSPGFGLKLVDMLTKQIDGSVTIERRNGTRFIFVFGI